MAFHVRLSRRAYADIDRVMGFIAERVGPESAARWRDGLIAVVDTLQTLPERCPLADEVEELGLQWRVLLYGRKRHVYRILFTIEGDTVTIHHVRHTAQDQLSADDL